MQKVYSRVLWKNEPSHDSPLNESNLNRMDYALDSIDDRVIELENTKATQSDLLESVKDISVNKQTGVITISWQNGTVKTYDTLLEKIATNWDFDQTTQRLVITLDDGSVKYVDLSSLIQQNEFVDSSTITASLDANGKVTHSVKKGSITDEYIEGQYLSNAQSAASGASVSASNAAASAASAAQSAESANLSRSEAQESASEAERYSSEAANSASAAKTSKENAESSAAIAVQKASDASASEINAKASEQLAGQSAASASVSASAADASKSSAEQSASSADKSQKNAAESESSAASSANMAKSYAVGTDGVVREKDATDNAEYYSRLARDYAEQSKTKSTEAVIDFDDITKMIRFSVTSEGLLRVYYNG